MIISSSAISSSMEDPVEFPHLAWQHDDNLISQQGKGKQNKKHKIAKTDGVKKAAPCSGSQNLSL